MSPDDLAKSLAANFLASGKYGTQPIFVGLHSPTTIEVKQIAEAFAEFIIDSVGYTKGANEEKVVIHLAGPTRDILPPYLTGSMTSVWKSTPSAK